MVSSDVINSITQTVSSNATRTTTATDSVDKQSIQNLRLDTDSKQNSPGKTVVHNDSFFRTAIDGDEDKFRPQSQSVATPSKRTPGSGTEVKLPITVNVVALRESLFVEAPFVNKNNKAFWRKMIDGKHFSNILAASYNFIAVCIAENGNVILDRLNGIHDSELIDLIATNVTDMFYTFKRLDRDLFFSRLPEVTMFLVIQSLQTAYPKHHRLYNTVKFREIILDWCTELLWGIRITNSHANREWVFHDAMDSNIMVCIESSVLFLYLYIYIYLYIYVYVYLQQDKMHICTK
jgi:hypothetical protein